MEARVFSAAIVDRQIIDGLDFARQKAASERRVSYIRNAQRTARRKNCSFAIARPERVLSLQCGERVCHVCAPQRFGTCFAKTDPAYFSLLDKTCHGAYRLFDGRIR